MSAPEETDAAVDGESIRRNAVFAMAVQLTTAAFTAGLTLYLVRALGPSNYGIFALAASFGALLLLPADFGITQSAARFIAERRGNRADIAAVLASALKLKLAAAALFSAALLLAAGPISAAYEQPALVWPLRGIALAVLGQSLMMLYQYAFVAIGRVQMNLRLIFSESAVEVGASVALVLLGAGAAGASFGRAIGYGFGALFGLGLAARFFGRRSVNVRRADAGQIARQVAGYASALLVIDLAYTALSQVDVLLIGAILGSASVGFFQPPVKLITFLHYPGLALANAVAPRLARHERLAPSVGAFERSLRGLIVLQAAIVAPVVAWASPIVELLLGSEYGESAVVLRALAPYIFLAGIAPLVSVGVNYLGEARRRVPIAIAALVVNLAIDLALLGKIGIVAGAIGTDVAFAIYVPAHFMICRRLLGLRLRPLLLTLSRALVAAGAMAGVLAAVGTSNLSLLDWTVGGAGGLLAFLVVLLATRELTIQELRDGWRALAGRLRRSST